MSNKAVEAENELEKVGDIRFIIFAILAFISLYGLTYIGIRIILEIFQSKPLDHSKVTNGLIMGFFISTIPYFILGWRLQKEKYSSKHFIAILGLGSAFIIEKVMLPFLAFLMIKNDQTMLWNEDVITSIFLLLSEELFYFTLGFWYIIFGTILSIVSFYLGVELSSRRRILLH